MSKALASLESCHVTSSRQGVNKYLQFTRFRAYVREFSIFFHEFYMVARSYRVLATNITILLENALVSLETSLKVPNLASFEDFWHFSSCLFWHKPLTQDNNFLRKLSPIKDFFVTVTIQPKIDTIQIRFLKNLAKYLLWSGPCKMPILVLLIRKT